MSDKVANIVSQPTMVSDDGRALGLEWQLFLNDHNGKGLWHGGPNHPRHASSHATEDKARMRAVALGYEVRSVRWE